MSLIVLTLAVCGANPAQVPVPALPPDTVVVCPQEFRAALVPWVAHRQQQGHRLKFLDNRLSEHQLRERIQTVARGRKLRFVVLVGDADRRQLADDQQRGRLTPTHYRRAEVIRFFGGGTEIATDNPFADLDNDGKPDVAIGRLSVENAAELKAVVAKILAYERSRDFGPWRRRVHFVAGVGGFGLLADMVLEMTTRKFLTDEIPHSYATTMTYGSWRSAYCPDPRQFRATTLQRLNEGSLFWVYIGHGQRQYLDFLRVPGRAYNILSIREVPKLRSAHGAPIAIFLSCHAGGFDTAQECLGEQMLRQPGGPVAVFSGSRVTMPYAMAVLSHGLLQEYFEHPTETLGEVILRAKRRLAAKPAPSADPSRALLDQLAAAISPRRELLDAERKEHLSLFNLLGDPLLRMKRPQTVALRAPAEVTAGQKIRVECRSPLAGEALIEFAYRRDRIRHAAPRRTQFDANSDALAAYNAVYRKANNPVWSHTRRRVGTEPFTVQFEVPADCYGSCYVRAFVQSPEGHAMGAAPVMVRLKR